MRLHEIFLMVLPLSLIPLGNSMRKIVAISIPAVSSILVAKSGFYEAEVLGFSGVELVFDEGSRIFMLVGSLVFLGVAIEKDSWRRSDFFLFCSSFVVVELLFMSADMFNLYVMMEILSIQAGLMILNDADSKKLWSTVKYLMVGSIGANLYLLGVGLVYAEHGTFNMTDLGRIDPIPTVLMVFGLMVRTGIFAFGMWLPQFHSNAPGEVSALLSSVFVESGIYAFYRMSKLGVLSDLAWMESLALVLALGGALMALRRRNFKDILASSTMAHLGISLFNPAVAPLGALAHAVSKAPLFLVSEDVKRGRLSVPNALLSIPLVLSLIGTYPTFGYVVKGEILKGWEEVEWMMIVIYSIIGYSVVSSLKEVEIVGWKPGWGVIYFSALVAVLSAREFPGFSILGLIPLIISLSALRFDVRLKIGILERLEELEGNVLTVLMLLSVAVGFVWLSRSL